MHSIHRPLWAPPDIGRDERRPPRRARALATCIGAAVLSGAMSMVCLWQAHEELSVRTLSNESRTWPSAPGETIDAKLARSGGRGSSVSASVRYRFIVGAKIFEGQTISFDRPRGTAAESAVRRYRPGTRVRVFFRPSDPSLSVLEVDSWTGWPRVGALTAAGSCAALFFLALLRVAVRIARRARPAL